MQLKYILKGEISDGHATGPSEVQARERYISDGHATGAIDVQAREGDIRWSCNGCT